MIPEVYLASSSPRRRELLAQLGVAFEIVRPAVDEAVMAGETPDDYVVRLALEKARVGWQLLRQTAKPQRSVIGADTCIVCGKELMGKPQDYEHFNSLFDKLSGTTHYVYSAVAVAGLAGGGGSKLTEHYRINRSSVEFREIPQPERDVYWKTGEPADKAGGYAIQGMAAAFVKNLNGSYSGVVGLPLFETSELLKEFGIDVVRVAPTPKN
jgi:septum formation protein